MAINTREDEGIKKASKTFADGSFIEIVAILDSDNNIDETLSEAKIDNIKADENKTDIEKQTTVFKSVDSTSTGTI